MTLKEKFQEALRIAKEIAKDSETATDFHNAFFGINGRFGQMFPERAERDAFFKSPEYEEIFQLRESLPEFQPWI
ncbi:MAG: hypothetical protein U0793_32995 [Gemmataceae bacterium]